MSSTTNLTNYIAYGVPIILTAYTIIAFLFAGFKIINNYAVESIFDAILAVFSFVAVVLATFSLWSANYGFGFATAILCLCFMTLSLTGRVKSHSGAMLVFWAVWFIAICNFILVMGPGPLGAYDCSVYQSGSTQSAMCKSGWLTYVAIAGTVILGCGGVIGTCLVNAFTSGASSPS